MDNLIFKIYKGKNKNLVSTTNSILNALRKYFIYFQEDSILEIWINKRLIDEYKKKTRNIEIIIHDLKDIIQSIWTLPS